MEPLLQEVEVGDAFQLRTSFSYRKRKKKKNYDKIWIGQDPTYIYLCNLKDVKQKLEYKLKIRITNRRQNTYKQK